MAGRGPTSFPEEALKLSRDAVGMVQARKPGVFQVQGPGLVVCALGGAGQSAPGCPRLGPRGREAPHHSKTPAKPPQPARKARPTAATPRPRAAFISFVWRRRHTLPRPTRSQSSRRQKRKVIRQKAGRGVGLDHSVHDNPDGSQTTIDAILALATRRPAGPAMGPASASIRPWIAPTLASAPRRPDRQAQPAA